MRRMLKTVLASLLLVSSLVSAGPVDAATVEQPFTVDGGFSHLCVGGVEAVITSGTGTAQVTTTTDEQGYTHVRVATSLVGVTGTGAVTWKRYRVVETADSAAEWVGLPPFESSGTMTHRLVGIGLDNDASVQVEAHVTVAADGGATVDFARSGDIVCSD